MRSGVPGTPDEETGVDLRTETPTYDFRLETVTLSSGDVIPLADSDVVVLVGPNNSGKSRALRELYGWSERPQPNRRVIKHAKFLERGSVKDFRAWLETFFTVRTDESGTRRVLTLGTDRSLSDSHWQESLRGFDTRLANYRPFLMHHLATSRRLELVNPVARRNLDQSPETYLHVLQHDRSLLERLQSDVKQAFGTSLELDTMTRSAVTLVVGRSRKEASIADHERALSAMRSIQDEGDGLKSFVGTLLALYCGGQRMLLIDEPEAFLHPSQTRSLVRTMVTDATKYARQIVIATHSADVVRTALSVHAQVAVCRLTRHRNTNTPRVIQTDELNALVSRPVLSSSLSLNALFHSAVVVCEAANDARFYELILEDLERAGVFSRSPDIHLAFGAGKGDLAFFARTYRSLGLATAVIADLDILRNRQELASLLASLGDDLARHERTYNEVVSALAAQKAEVSPDEYVTGLRRVASRVRRTKRVEPKDHFELTELYRGAADWSTPKRVGTAALSGGALTAARNLLSSFRELGLHLVCVGELERWWKEGPASKSEWIGQVVALSDKRLVMMPEAVGFILEVVEQLGIRIRRSRIPKQHER